MSEITISEKSYDVIVIGAGLAGIRAAVTCAKENKTVLLVSSSVLCSGSSFYPLMDALHCLVTAGEQDKESFYRDIEDCSCSMHDEQMNRYYIDRIEHAVSRMDEMGIICQKLPEKKIACFGHTYRDLYYWKDWNAIRENVRRTIAAYPRLHVMEHTADSAADRRPADQRRDPCRQRRLQRHCGKSGDSRRRRTGRIIPAQHQSG